MKQNELRIGNWFFDGFKDKDGNLIPTTVKAIPEKVRPDEFLEPIPITPEILEKCGFEDKNGVYRKDSFFIYRPGGPSFDYGFGIKGLGVIRSIKHLHQLQNLIYITSDIELDINL